MYTCVQKENMQHSSLSDVPHSSHHEKPPIRLQLRRMVHQNQKPTVPQNIYRKPLKFTEPTATSGIGTANLDSQQSLASPVLNDTSDDGSESYPSQPNSERTRFSISTLFKSFDCELCGKRFLHSYTLNRHLRTHTGEKPFPCDMCGRCFARSDKVQRHRRTHTGEKPFHCKTCDKSFARSDKLRQHERTHRNIF